MEEIVATDAMKAEILEDARKKAEHILREADEQSAREAEAGRSAAAKASGDIGSESTARIARRKAESEARLPLDSMRLRTEFVDRALREAARDFVSSLPEAEMARIALSMIEHGAPFLAGKRARVARKGLPASAAAAAAAAIGPDAIADAADGAALPAAGLAAFAEDGSASLYATADLIEERLLEEKRAELAQALCAEALGLGSDARGRGAGLASSRAGAARGAAGVGA
jgi:vacuolar-type H+-ATPase subunit E/Vma4